MKDRTPTKVLDNGALRYGVYDEAGNFLRYEYLGLEDEPTQEGTPLNKATLLKDATAALFDLGSDALPDDVFAKIRPLITSAVNNANSRAKIEVGSYVGTNKDTKTIKCSFSPKFFAITAIGSGVFAVPFYYAPLPSQNTPYNFYYLQISSSESISVTLGTTITRKSNGVEISSSRFSAEAFNATNVTYYYAFIG